MIGRRGILGIMAGAPAAAVVGSASSVVSGSSWDTGQVCNPAPDPGWQDAASLADLIRREVDGSDFGVNIPPHIASKKSWSDKFKHDLARAEFMERRKISRAIDDALHGDPLTRMASLTKLAKQMGIT